MQDDDLPYSGVAFTASDIMLIAECVRFGNHYWGHILNQNPNDEEALKLKPLFDDLLPKIEILDADREELEDDVEDVAEEIVTSEDLPNNVLTFPS